MPEKETLERAREDAREGKSPSTQAGEFVREEIHHVREGKHGVRNAKQAIAIGLSKARKAGVKLPPAPGRNNSSDGSSSASTPRKSQPSRRRSRATLQALKEEKRSGASSVALARQTREAAQSRSKKGPFPGREGSRGNPKTGKFVPATGRIDLKCSIDLK